MLLVGSLWRERFPRGAARNSRWLHGEHATGRKQLRPQTVAAASSSVGQPTTRRNRSERAERAAQLNGSRTGSSMARRRESKREPAEPSGSGRTSSIVTSLVRKRTVVMREMAGVCVESGARACAGTRASLAVEDAHAGGCSADIDDVASREAVLPPWPSEPGASGQRPGGVGEGSAGRPQPTCSRTV